MRSEMCSSPREEFCPAHVSLSQRDCFALSFGENTSEARHGAEAGLGRPQPDQMSDATVMLAAIQSGDPNAAEQLLVLVYDELRRLAASKLAHEAPGQTLQPTALVHEAW